MVSSIHSSGPVLSGHPEKAHNCYVCTLELSADNWTFSQIHVIIIGVNWLRAIALQDKCL